MLATASGGVNSEQRRRTHEEIPLAYALIAIALLPELVVECGKDAGRSGGWNERAEAEVGCQPVCRCGAESADRDCSRGLIASLVSHEAVPFAWQGRMPLKRSDDGISPPPAKGGRFAFPEVGTLVSLAGLLVGLAGPLELQPVQRVEVICLTVALVTLMVIRRRQRSAAPSEACRKRPRRHILLSWLFHPDQERAGAEYPFYSDAMRRHPRLLGIASRILAADAGISRLEAAILLRFPQLVPHYEYLEPLERALYLPRGHFRRGGGYGHRLCIARILHLHRRGFVASSMIHGIGVSSDPKKVREALRVIEEQVWDDLARKGKVR